MPNLSPTYLDRSAALRRYDAMMARPPLTLPPTAWDALARRLLAAADLVLGDRRVTLRDRALEAAARCRRLSFQ